jgi:hypothetical protein
MTRIRIVGCVIGVALALTVTGCASRPTTEELTNSILTAASADTAVELSQEQASCIAQTLLDSDLSDTTLAGLAEDFDNPQVLQTEVDDVKPLVESAALQCVTG